MFKRGKQTPIKKKKKKEHFFGFLLTVLSIWDTSLSVINDALNFLCHARALAAQWAAGAGSTHDVKNEGLVQVFLMTDSWTDLSD